MKRRNQGIKIKDTESLFKILLWRVPQRSILDPILLSIFINGLLFFVNEEKSENFADDNTICSAKSDLNTFLRFLEKQSEEAIELFSNNNMIVNPN